MILSMERISKIERLTQEEIELLESLFRDNLKESPINIKMYENMAESDEDIRFCFESMLDCCLNYTEDVAKMERYVREHKGEYDEEREGVDQARTRAHDAMIASVNIFARVLKTKSKEVAWLKWEENNRGGYGNFAILLTLNRFKNDLIARKLLQKIEKIEKTDIDFKSLKEGANDIEIKIINYVEILSERLRAEVSDNQNTINNEPVVSAKLKEIEDELQQDEESILGAFHQIYLRRYKL
jgi:hypothetical protein